MKPEIRPADTGDDRVMAALEAEATDRPWSPQQYADSIESHSCWLLEKRGSPVGLLVFSRVLDDAELLNIAVARACRGRGFGTQLMHWLIDQNRDRAKRIHLEVRESNDAAIGLYRRFGFTLSGRRKSYYPRENGREDALLMCYEYE